MITIACVNHRDYLGRGDQYVATLRNMVERNLTLPYKFVCLKDEGGYAGWWAKVELFRPGRFEGRVAYFDLDGVIVGNIDELVSHKGIIDLYDWGWKTHTLGTGVMVWDAGEHAEVFNEFGPGVPQTFRGDQDYVTWQRDSGRAYWPILPAHLCRSYRYHCVKKPPPGCVHVSMHGLPKCHEITTGWVPDAWH